MIDQAFFNPQGLYSEIGHYKLPGRSVMRGYLFSSRNSLQLAECRNAEASVGRFGLDGMSVANVRSTGHDVAVSEVMHTTVIVPLTGKLISSTLSEETQAHTGGMLVFPPNRRQTRVIADKNGRFNAVNILIPYNEIRDALLRLEYSPRAVRRLNGIEGWLDGGALPAVAGFRALVATLHGEICQGGAVIRWDSTRKAWRRLIVDKLAEVLASAEDMLISPDLAPAVRNAYVEKALDYMRANHTTIAPVADVAKSCGISTRTLEQAFRQNLGITPYQAITEMRLDTARRLLSDPDRVQSVTEIALVCGISHLGRFAKQYQSRFGELPSETMR
ncbi:helix-turn-helix transcriptional regulator [Sedimentitalea sp. JM2-8]|uniref:Helix-turn-helix transcriptional regulator n=1 Tax=Sedimentitalea xiamensis TaxID=3050037 RepID=A0ABT7FGQ5_9RHOB|nr:helix-turn-helix transcriptional regulator [Sedimentitalea xiamensis]MDK3074302.1 helix-turn-helix transcriptional regulator [Sedimentitalea xiamensis]